MAKKMKEPQRLITLEEKHQADGGNAQPATAPNLDQKGEQPLSVKERNQLKSCEETIAASLRSAFDVGEALRTINEGRLYRGNEYSNFDVYCENRWSMSGSHARRLIDAADIMDKLRKRFSPKGEDDDLLPESESHVRPLVRLKDKPDEQIEAWEEALEKAEAENKHITGRMVDAIVDEMLGIEAEPEAQPDDAADTNSDQEDTESDEENSDDADETASEVLEMIAEAKTQLENGETQRVAEYLDRIQELIREHFGISD